MRRSATGTGARHIDVRPVGRRRGAVRNDGGGTVVAPAEGDTRDVEFGRAVAREVFPGQPSRKVARRALVLDLALRLDAERIREALRVRGVAHRERPAL